MQRLSVSAAPAASRTMPTTRGQSSETRSNPNHPKRSIAVAATSCPAMRRPTTAVVPICGPAIVIESTMNAPSAPPVSIHQGCESVSPRPPVPCLATRRIGNTSTPVTIAASITASSAPMRSPRRPITATWAAPNTPAETARAAARPVESMSRDAIRSRLPDPKELRVIRVFVVYDAEPDPDRYEGAR